MPWLRQDTSPSDLGRTRHSLGYDALEYEFHLEVEGKLTGIFQVLKGGDMEIAQVKHDIVYESGSSTTLLIPGATSFAPISLERGYANYDELYAWFMEASNGRIIQARRNGTIYMMRHSEVLLMWNFEGAWPTKLSGFAYNQYADARKARISITIAAETILYAEVPPYTVEGPSTAEIAQYFRDWFPTS
jgi:phage tail-like protein